VKEEAKRMNKNQEEEFEGTNRKKRLDTKRN